MWGFTYICLESLMKLNNLNSKNVSFEHLLFSAGARLICTFDVVVPLSTVGSVSDYEESSLWCYIHSSYILD